MGRPLPRTQLGAHHKLELVAFAAYGDNDHEWLTALEVIRLQLHYPTRACAGGDCSAPKNASYPMELSVTRTRNHGHLSH